LRQRVWFTSASVLDCHYRASVRPARKNHASEIVLKKESQLARLPDTGGWMPWGEQQDSLPARTSIDMVSTPLRRQSDHRADITGSDCVLRLLTVSDAILFLLRISGEPAAC